MELVGNGRERELKSFTDSSVGVPRRRALRAEMKAGEGHQQRSQMKRKQLTTILLSENMREVDSAL